MAQNVTIAGASYLGVPRIEMPKTGGGTAVFVDTSDANAAAGDITKGKTAYVGGTKITGTLEASSSGGGAPSLQSKSVTYTANGTATITPDAGYDGLSSVDVTVNVSGGGGVETCTLTVSAGAHSTFYGVIYACSGDTFIEITSVGMYSINKNSIVAFTRIGSRDSYTGLEELKNDGAIRVCFVTSDIATYKYTD